MTELAEDNVLAQQPLTAQPILSVDAVAMLPIGSLPPVVIEEAAIDFGVQRIARYVLPHADARREIVKNKIDELQVRTFSPDAIASS